MPVRSRDGLVHAVAEPAGKHLHGVTACGVVYARKRKGSLWKVHGADKTPHMRPTSKRTTCVACIACVMSGLRDVA